MISRRIGILGFLILVGSSTSARAGIEPNTYVYRSASQEQGSTHVLVGTIRAFHPINASKQAQDRSPSRVHNTYLVEMEILKVEKGSGIQAGDFAIVRFHSPATIDEIEHPFPGFGCGQVNAQIAPALGELARIYVVRDESFQLVADYPQSFFRISEKERKSSDPAIARFVAAHPWGLTILVGIVGISIGWVASCCGKNRPANLELSKLT